MKQTSVNPDLEVLYPASSVSPQLEPLSRNDAVIARLRLLWDRRRFLLRCCATGLLVATIVAFLIPKRYESTTRLMPPDDKSGSALAIAAELSGKVPGGLSALAGDALGLKSNGALFMGILSSRTVQDNLINKFDLKRVYSAATYERARKRLSENTSIYEDHKSGIVTISVTDHDPQRAATLAQAYALELNRVVVQLNTSSAHRERAFLEERLQQVKKDLEQAEKDFSAFASKNTAIDIKEQAKAMVGAAASLQGELIATQSELEGLKQIYTDNNVRVRALQARVSELKSQLNKIGGQTESSSGTKDSIYPSIRELPLLGVTYADLYRQTKVQEAVFEALTQRYEMAKVAEAKETPNVQVLDPAEVPERKAYPPRLLIMVLGTMASFVLSVLWVVARVRWDEVDDDNSTKLLFRDAFDWLRAHFLRMTSRLRLSPIGIRFRRPSHTNSPHSDS